MPMPTTKEITTVLEAILFVAGKPLTVKTLATHINVSEEIILNAIATLQQQYVERNSGLRLISTDTTVQLYTSPEVGEIVSDFMQKEVVAELTKPQLETLSVIAYRGPLYKEELEHIRGVNCTLILRNLLVRGLVQMHETNQGEQYEVSADFLAHIGLSCVEDLPDFATLSTHERIDEVMAEVTTEAV